MSGESLAVRPAGVWAQVEDVAQAVGGNFPLRRHARQGPVFSIQTGQSFKKLQLGQRFRDGRGFSRI